MADAGLGGPGGPPGGNETRPPLLTWIARELERAAVRARVRRNRVLLWLTVLALGAVGAVCLGLLADNDRFWVAAAFAFSSAAAVLVAYAAKELDIFSEAVALLGRSAVSDERVPAKEPDAIINAQRRPQLAFEKGAELQRFAALQSTNASPEERAIVDRLFLEAAKHFEPAAKHEHPVATCRLGQLFADGSAGKNGKESRLSAEECFVKASVWGSLVAPYNLGALHAMTESPVHSSEWWLNLARKAPVAAYLAGRYSPGEAGFGAQDVPFPPSNVDENDFLPRLKDVI
jgi:hypothetical protein